MKEIIQENAKTAHPSLSPTLQNASCVSEEKLCIHCRSPVLSSKKDSVFCCRGCEFVYHTLQGLGLSSFYSMQNADDVPHPRNESSANRKYIYLDEEQSKQNYVQELPGGFFKIRLYLSGIHCAACIWLLEKLPSVLQGVLSARVQFASGEIEIDFDPRIVKASEIAYTLNSLGYPPVPMVKSAVAEADKKKERTMMLRIGVAAFCTSNIMMFSVSLFQGYFTGIEEPYATLFKWLCAILALPVVLYSAIPFYKSAFASLLTGTLHIDLPIAAAIICTYISGIITTIKGEEYVYFDSITLLILLLLVGRWMQSRAVNRTRASSFSAWDLLPTTVRIVEDDKVVEKALQKLMIGDLVEVLPGDRVPSDGIVIKGNSAIDSSFLTGESLPQEINEGSIILGGCINLESRLLVRATKLGEDSRLGGILKDIEKTQSQRTPAEDRANKLSNYFVFGVFGLAVLCYLTWYFIDASRAFDITVSFLIITCPCALGLAIPSVVTVALGRAKKRGIFIRRSDAFEALAETRHFYFDKTGTLTSGEIIVQETYGNNIQSISYASTLAKAAPLHPISQAIVKYCAEQETSQVNTLKNIKQVPGRGIIANQDNNAVVRLGSLTWLKESECDLNKEQVEILENWNKAGFSISGLAIDTKIVCLFGLAAAIAPYALEISNYLKKTGRRIFILSGDSQGAVDAVAKKLSIESYDAKGELFPEQKLQIISQDDSRNCMIGDGLNDAPAMKKSDISIGLRGGIEATIEVASLYISSGNLKDLLAAIQAADQTTKIIKNNLIYSLAYNSIGGLLALLGYINPLIAAILMPVSSITVVSYSLLSKTFRNK